MDQTTNAEISQKTPLSVGIIGAGWFASRRHVPDLAALKEVEIAAACRRDQAALSLFCDHFGIPGRYADYRQMLDRESLDAVLISSPHSCHFEQAAECLQRGLHVLLEKPIALTGADAEALANLAVTQKRVLAVALNPPYWAHCHLVRSWVAEGRIGQLEAVDICWLSSVGALFGKAPLAGPTPGIVPPTSFRGDAALGGGGHLMDGGQHNIAELLWITGQNPTSISAVMDRLPIDLRTSVSLIMNKGVVASVTGIADSKLGSRRAYSAYYGSEGTLRISVLPFRVSWERPGLPTEVIEETGFPTISTPAADLIQCIRTGQAPLGSPDLALRTTRIIEAAYQSAGAARIARC